MRWKRNNCPCGDFFQFSVVLIDGELEVLKKCFFKTGVRRIKKIEDDRHPLKKL